MLIKVKTDIILNVKDDGEAEEACHALNQLEHVMITNGFPHEVVETEVDHWEKVSKQEATEQGWEE